MARMQQQLRDYLSEASVHGFKYVVHRRLPVASRLAWSAAIGTSLFLAALLVQSSLHEASVNPVVSSFELAELGEIPFPAVSVSPGDMPSWIRFPEEVFNGVQFDCVREGEDCPGRRGMVLERYGDFVRSFVRKAFDAVRENVMLNPEMSYRYCAPCLCDNKVVRQENLEGLVRATTRELSLRYVCTNYVPTNFASVNLVTGCSKGFFPPLF